MFVDKQNNSILEYAVCKYFTLKIEDVEDVGNFKNVKK